VGWATQHIDKLKQGETVEFRPRGNSMSGIIESGQLCTVVPVSSDLKKGDVVLCRVGRAQYLHLIKSIRGNRYQIGNNKGHINGWIGIDNIYGVLIGVK
jgi:phage repressor protein C with HTH and peptisase S24 domain